MSRPMNDHALLVTTFKTICDIDEEHPIIIAINDNDLQLAVTGEAF